MPKIDVYALDKKCVKNFQHYIRHQCFPPSLLHILKMMMNAVATLQPMVEYSTFLLFLFFSTLHLFLFFLTISLPPPTFVCVHSFVFPFPLLFIVVFQLHSLHSFRCKLQNLKNAHNFQQQTQTPFDNYPIFFIFEHLACHIHFFICPLSFN